MPIFPSSELLVCVFLYKKLKQRLRIPNYKEYYYLGDRKYERIYYAQTPRKPAY